MLWLLVQPPEVGGRGFSPSEAKKLTLSEAEFYLMSKEQVEASCRRMNRISRGEPELTAAEDYQRMIEERRKHFTGSEEKNE